MRRKAARVLRPGGALVAKNQLGFTVIKTAAEQWVAEAAHKNSLLYGIATAMLAVLVGWLASLIFRRD